MAGKRRPDGEFVVDAGVVDAFRSSDRASLDAVLGIVADARELRPGWMPAPLLVESPHPIPAHDESLQHIVAEEGVVAMIASFDERSQTEDHSNFVRLSKPEGGYWGVRKYCGSERHPAERCWAGVTSPSVLIGSSRVNILSRTLYSTSSWGYRLSLRCVGPSEALRSIAAAATGPEGSKTCAEALRAHAASITAKHGDELVRCVHRGSSAEGRAAIGTMLAVAGDQVGADGLMKAGAATAMIQFAVDGTLDLAGIAGRLLRTMGTTSVSARLEMIDACVSAILVAIEKADGDCRPLCDFLADWARSDAHVGRTLWSKGWIGPLTKIAFPSLVDDVEDDEDIETTRRRGESAARGGELDQGGVKARDAVMGVLEATGFYFQGAHMLQVLVKKLDVTQEAIASLLESKTLPAAAIATPSRLDRGGGEEEGDEKSDASSERGRDDFRPSHSYSGTKATSSSSTTTTTTSVMRRESLLSSSASESRARKAQASAVASSFSTSPHNRLGASASTGELRDALREAEEEIASLETSVRTLKIRIKAAEQMSLDAPKAFATHDADAEAKMREMEQEMEARKEAAIASAASEGDGLSGARLRDAYRIAQREQEAAAREVEAGSSIEAAEAALSRHRSKVEDMVLALRTAIDHDRALVDAVCAAKQQKLDTECTLVGAQARVDALASAAARDPELIRQLMTYLGRED